MHTAPTRHWRQLKEVWNADLPRCTTFVSIEVSCFWFCKSWLKLIRLCLDLSKSVLPVTVEFECFVYIPLSTFFQQSEECFFKIDTAVSSSRTDVSLFKNWAVVEMLCWRLLHARWLFRPRCMQVFLANISISSFKWLTWCTWSCFLLRSNDIIWMFINGE